MNKRVRSLSALPAASAGILLALALNPQTAAADSILPPATYYEVASRQGVGPYHDAYMESYQPGTVSVIIPGSFPDQQNAVATTGVRLSGTDTLNPFISATTTYANTFEGNAFAQITYSFEITGPSGLQVPLDLSVTGSHTFSPSDPYAADDQFASFTIRDPLTNALIFDKSCTADGCNFSANPVDLISTNEVLSVYMSINGGSGPGTVQTSLDDTIAIDPANTVSGAALVFSPGLVVTTPEPAAFWLSLAGFLCAGLVRPLRLICNLSKRR